MLSQLGDLNTNSRLQAKKLIGAYHWPDPSERHVLAGEQGLSQRPEWDASEEGSESANWKC